MRLRDLPVDHPLVSSGGALDELLQIEWHARSRPCPWCTQKHARTAAALQEEAWSLSGGMAVHRELADRVRAVADLADDWTSPEIIAAEARNVRRRLQRFLREELENADSV